MLALFIFRHTTSRSPRPKNGAASPFRAGALLSWSRLVTVTFGIAGLGAFVFAQPPGSVVITEVMYDDTASGANPDVEWVEIYNTTGNPIVLDNWILTDGNVYPPPSSEGAIEIPFGTLIHPGQFLVLAKQSIPEIPQAILCAEIDPVWGLSNFGDNLALFDPIGIPIDGSLTLNYPDLSPSNSGISIEKCDVNSPWSPDPLQWHTSTNFFSTGRYQLCTPGFSNSPCTINNDDCFNAPTVGLGSRSFSNVGATTDGPPDPYPCDVPADIWYCFEVFAALCPRVLQVSLCGSGYDTQLAVYGPYPNCQCPDPGTAMMCDDDFCGVASGSQVVFPAPPGFYMIRIGGFAGAQGTGVMDISFVDPPPSNDSCASAQIISSGNYGFTTCGATTDGPLDPYPCDCPADIWYRWQAPCDGNARVSLCGSSYNTQVAIYPAGVSGNCPAPGMALACNDDFCGQQSEVNWNVVDNEWYFVRIGGFNGARGFGTFTIETTPPCSEGPCVNVGYIRVTPSDGLLDHSGIINYVAVELTNTLNETSPLTLRVSTCEDTATVQDTLDPLECKLLNLPLSFSPSANCAVDFVQVEALNAGSCGANASSAKRFPRAYEPFQIVKRHDSSSPVFYQALVNGESPKAVEIRWYHSGPCSVQYFKIRLGENIMDNLRDPITVTAFANDGPGGLPGTPLMTAPGLTTRSSESWAVYAIPPEPIPVSSGAIYAAVELTSHCAPGGSEAISCDAEVDTPEVYFQYETGSWVPFVPPGDFMIDAYLRCPCETAGQSATMEYEYVTSDDPGGPVFNWEDVSATGITWSDSCPNCNFQTLCFSFPFGGQFRPEIKVSLNGLLSFQDPGLGVAHAAMPNSAYPNEVIAPLWTESESCIDYSGEIYYWEAPDSSRVVIQWDNILANNERLTFEAILYPTGEILCQYLDAPTLLNYTVGLENASGTDALQVYTDGGCPPLRDDFAIRFAPLLPPAGPSSLVVNVSGNDLVLIWDAIPSHVYYEVYRSNVESFPAENRELIAVTTDTSYVDTGALDGSAPAFYRVIASNERR